MQVRKLLITLALATGATAASAAVLLGQTPIGLTGTFTVTLTNCTTTTTATAKYTKNTVTGVVTLLVPYAICTASAAPTYLSGLPPELFAADPQFLPVTYVRTGSNDVPGAIVIIKDSADLQLRYWNGATFTGSFAIGAAKGLSGAFNTITYQGYPDT